MSVALFVQLQCTLRQKSGTVTGEALWPAMSHGNSWSAQLRLMLRCFAKAIAGRVEGGLFRAEFVLHSYEVTDQVAARLDEECLRFAPDDPNRITWTERPSGSNGRGWLIG